MDEVLAPRWSGLSALLTADEDGLPIAAENDSLLRLLTNTLPQNDI